MNALPTMQNLKLRGVNTTGFCPLCDKVLETLPHALLHCKRAKQTWACWQNCLVDVSLESQDILDIALNLLDKGTAHDLELFFIVAWTVWAASGDSKNYNIRVIIRDNHGSPLAAMSKLLPMPYSANVTGALALPQGVQLSIEMNLSQTIFESDALSLVQALNSREAEGELGHILQEIRNTKNSFSFCSF
nr:hypothetical protein CFP56_25128 [Quercus suber]